SGAFMPQNGVFQMGARFGIAPLPDMDLPHDAQTLPPIEIARVLPESQRLFYDVRSLLPAPQFQQDARLPVEGFRQAMRKGGIGAPSGQRLLAPAKRPRKIAFMIIDLRKHPNTVCLTALMVLPTIAVLRPLSMRSRFFPRADIAVVHHQGGM